MNTVSQEEIDHLLDSDPHIQHNFPDGNWIIPKINLRLWRESRRDRVVRSLDTMIDFLQSPYIVDDFEDMHAARIEWINSLKIPEARIYLRTSALRSSKIGQLNHAHSLGLLYRGSNPDQLAYFSELVQDQMVHGEACLGMNSSDKMDMVYNLKNLVYGLLWFLSIQSPGPSSD